MIIRDMNNEMPTKAAIPPRRAKIDVSTILELLCILYIKLNAEITLKTPFGVMFVVACLENEVVNQG